MSCSLQRLMLQDGNVRAREPTDARRGNTLRSHYIDCRSLYLAFAARMLRRIVMFLVLFTGRLVTWLMSRLKRCELSQDSTLAVEP